MSFKIETTPRFEKNVKKLHKRFPKIKEDLMQLIAELKNNPTMGTHLGAKSDCKTLLFHPAKVAALESFPIILLLMFCIW